MKQSELNKSVEQAISVWPKKVLTQKKISKEAYDLTLLYRPKMDKKWKDKWVKPLVDGDQYVKVQEFQQGVLRLNKNASSFILMAPIMTKSTLFSSEMDPTSEGDYGQTRDQLASFLSSIDLRKHKKIQLVLACQKKEQLQGAMMGLEMMKYKFKECFKNKKNLPLMEVVFLEKSLNNKDLKAIEAQGMGVNLARHLVSLPANWLNPSSYEAVVRQLFKNQKHIKIEVWNQQRLEKEGMGLHLAVGQAASHGPRMIHLKYRPPGTSKKKPVGLIGKGITFDSGGLNIKPSGGMRLMKKDMGGSAALMGLAQWATQSGVKTPCDFFIGLAENAIAGNAFRPSDVLEARNGMTIEIHNTDAEGRLVLADVLDVAASKKEDWKCLIDVATLTGAIKVGLGRDVAGLFSNSKALSDQLMKCGEAAGDPMWAMPLVQKYRSLMGSTFADWTNCTDGFGGAITAALFLENFVRQNKWAHLDIYAWNDRAQGALTESGGSGQAVQSLAKFLE